MNILASLEKRRRPFWMIAGPILIAGICAVDVLTGPELSLSIFYLIPIVLVAWFAGRRLGFAMSFGGAAAWFTADYLSGQSYSNPWIRFWNAAVRLGFFVVVAQLLPVLKALERESHLAHTDDLTGVANRRLFFELLQKEIDRSQRYKHQFTLALLDIDNFKYMNDQFGHSTGDEVLRVVALLAKSSLRQTDVVARLGGDEFALLLPETNQAAAQITIAKVQGALLDEVRRNGWPVTFSIGALTCIERGQPADELIRRVDELLYSAKNRGKNTCEYEVYAG